ncbi:MAG: hypothetical protein RLZZ350_470 [Verrucomicrobiota bacterium]|jgi:hypothetical protein
MILDRNHWPWCAFVLVASAVASLLYLANFHPDVLPFHLPLPTWLGPTPPLRGTVGGSPLGLFFGGAAFAIFIFAALLGARRKKPAWRIGRVQVWLKAHIWLTLLTVPLIALHCGLATGGPMTQLLLALYAVVMISGFYGLALQQFLPRMMKEQIPLETIFEQIPHIRKTLHEAALKIRKTLDVAPAAAPAPVATPENPTPAPVEPPSPNPSVALFKDFLDQEALPYLAATRGDKLRLGNQRMADDFFRALKVTITPDFHADAERLQGWCDERRQLDLQTRYQHWLHGWLFVHAPLSFVLLALTAWHIFVTVWKY